MNSRHFLYFFKIFFVFSLVPVVLRPMKPNFSRKQQLPQAVFSSCSPLHYAVSMADVEGAAYILANAGMQVQKFIATQDKATGFTPLHIAVMNNQVEMVKILAHYAQDNIIRLAFIDDHCHMNSMLYALKGGNAQIIDLLKPIHQRKDYQNYHLKKLMAHPQPMFVPQQQPLSIPQPVLVQPQPVLQQQPFFAQPQTYVMQVMQPKPVVVEQNAQKVTIDLTDDSNEIMVPETNPSKQQSKKDMPTHTKRSRPEKQHTDQFEPVVTERPNKKQRKIDVQQQDSLEAIDSDIQEIKIHPRWNKPFNDTDRTMDFIAQHKESKDLFGALLSTQNLYRNQNLATIKKYLNKQYKKEQKIFEGKKELARFSDFFKNIVNSEHENQTECIIDLLNSDIETFIDFLCDRNFVKTKYINAEDLDEDIASVVARYNMFIRWFFLSEDIDADEYIFTVANNFFTYCFGTDSYLNFKSFLNNSDYTPVLKLIYSVINQNFTLEGWNNWSEDCLCNLKKEADTGKCIHYIAGGCDIHALIDSGIYNVKIIDPFFPSQETFYTSDWLWFVQNVRQGNGIGDTILFGDQHLTLKRTKYEEFGTFTAMLATGKACEIPKSITTWLVLNMDNNNEIIGEITIERRFCTKEDFIQDVDKSVVIGFTELCCATEKNSWGIDFSEIPADSKLFVKQLHKPINNQIARNLADAQQDEIPFQFCKLGIDCN